jgi:hypothetical protein
MFADFQDDVRQELNKIITHVENHSIILNELLRTHRHLQQEKLIAPPNLPMFPIGDLEGFIKFDNSIRSDNDIYDFMVIVAAKYARFMDCNTIFIGKEISSRRWLRS